MCELLGICSNYEVSPNFSFKEIKIRGGKSRFHDDGWGIGFYINNTSKILKEPEPAYSSELAKEIEDGRKDLRSKIFIAHIRRGTSGSNTLENTHPFMNKLFGKEWIFAHNGIVGEFTAQDGIFTEPLINFKPKGQTDSEYAFCYILDQLKEKCGQNSTLEEIAKVIAEAANYVKKYGNFNFILSDSEYIFAFGDNSLFYIKREHAEGKTLCLDDADYSIEISDMKMEGEKAIIIATSPLTKTEKWSNGRINGLEIFKDGEEVSPKKRVKNMKKEEIEVLKFIKSQRNRVSISKMAEELNKTMQEIKDVVKELTEEGYLKQDSRDSVPHLNEEATYYTNPDPSKQEEIKAIIAPAQNKEYVWYAGYGSNLDKQRFMCYIEGGMPDFCNKVTPNVGCSDKTKPLGYKKIEIPYELYFAKRAPRWFDEGVAFLDLSKEGNTLAGMWLITRQQFEDVRRQEGSWYDKEVTLGEEGIPIVTITHSTRFPTIKPSQGYLKTIIRGLKKTYPEMSDEQIVEYLASKEGMKDWKKEDILVLCSQFK